MSKMIELSDEHYSALERVAAARGQSPDMVLVRLLTSLGPVTEPPTEALWEQAAQVIGRYHGGAVDVARNHDAYLDEAYSA